jgi:hypothetical protein
MSGDTTDKIDITLRVSQSIKDQIDEVAEANGLKIGEQARQLVLIALRAEQLKLKQLGLIEPQQGDRTNTAEPEPAKQIKGRLLPSQIRPPLELDAP